MSKRPTDWADARRMAVRNHAAISDEEDAAITEAALADPDAQPVAALIRKGGRPRLERPKQQIALRVDADVLAHFQAEGPGWQSRMNAALRKAVGLPEKAD
jgi:uncharacterized protein (DUF4415 family)